MVNAFRGRVSKRKQPHEIVTEQPRARAANALLRNLAESVGGKVAYVIPGECAPEVVESWPPGLTSVAGAIGSEQVRDGGTLYVIEPKNWNEEARIRHRDTATWLSMAVRLARLEAEYETADLRASRLGAGLDAARTRLEVVRDLERHRLAGAITATTLRDLGKVRRLLHEWIETGSGLIDAENALSELIDDFRVVVRGVFPAMLPDSGPRAALEELAATVPRPVSFTGELGARTGWQLESGYYHAVAAVLNLVGDAETAQPVTVAFGRDDALRARITVPGAPAVGTLRSALAQDIERIAVLGGELSCTVVDGVAQVTVRLPERSEPVASLQADLSELERSALFRQVRELVRQGREAAESAVARSAWNGVAERLTSAPRLAVVGGGRDVGEAAGTTVLLFDAPPDAALAEELVADGNPRGGVDGVLCAVPPTPEFRAVLRGAKQRVVLVEAGPAAVAPMAAALAVRAPVIAARRAVVAMSELTRSPPPDHRLRWAVERMAIDTHEFAELDLLDAVEGGESLRGVAAEAARLLGAEGISPRSRLGLPAEATDTVVAATAAATAGRWRTYAEHAAVGARDRAACELLIRTAEGLVL